MPVLYSLLLSDSSFDDLMSVIREENGFLLLIPLTVVLAANLFFEEHDYDTLKNLMCVPVTKGRLTMAKLFVLLIFDIAYEAAGYMIEAAMSVISGIRLEEAGQQLILTLATPSNKHIFGVFDFPGHHNTHGNQSEKVE